MWGPYLRPVASKKSEIAILKDEAEALKDSLNAIQERIQDLEGEEESDK
jgi:predicted  nucleic acid-binding Zn-ribbon protein